MDTAAQERILSSLKAKGYDFADYRELCAYADRLDQRAISPVDEDALTPDERDFLNEDEVEDVLRDIAAQRYPEALEKSGVNIDGMM